MLSKTLAPVLAHTMEEVWDFYLPNSSSIHLETFKIEAIDKPVLADWEILLAFRSEAFKALELAREQKLIGKSLEAKLIIKIDTQRYNLLKTTFKDKLAQWLIISQFELIESSKNKLEVLRAEGLQCPRCWNISLESDTDGLCPRCHHVIHD